MKSAGTRCVSACAPGTPRGRRCFCSTASARVEPFLELLEEPAAIFFDVPGVGGSPAPALPYRPSTLARLSARLLDQLGHDRADVLGVSWGGALAQQFAFQHASRCRRVVLAAASPGHLMIPGRLTVLLKMASPRRYRDAEYMKRILDVPGELRGQEVKFTGMQ